MGSFTVQITREDLLKGKPHNALCCPVARAVGRIFPDTEVRVTTNSLFLNQNRFQSPGLEEFVTRFDCGYYFVSPVQMTFPPKEED